MTTVKMGYPVLMIEYKRGWGSKPDGYLIFRTSEARAAYIAKKYADRDPRQVPDYYVNYELVAPVELSEATEKKWNEKGTEFIYVDELGPRVV